MSNVKLDRIIAQIAKENNTTPQAVRNAMQEAMDEAMTTENPIAKAKWAAIPKKGAVLTLEEFIEYAAKQIRP